MDATLLDELMFLGNSLRSWIYAGVAFSVTFTVLPLARAYVASRRRRLAHRGVLPAVELGMLLIASTRRLFLWAIALYFGARFLELRPRADRALDVVVVSIAWMQAAFWAVAAVRFALDRQRVRAGPSEGALGSIDVILFIARIAIFAVAFLLALDNLDVDITALVAGLGITGIAVALAVQTVLGDLLASLSITFDKPFQVGDVVSIDDLTGTVQHIGVKSTRLKSVSGEQLVLANADVLKSRVRNFGRMHERRVAFFIGVTYDTPIEKLRAIPGIVRETIESQRSVRFDRCHFLEYGDSALRFEVAYFVLSSDFSLHADILQNVNLALFERFRALGIDFAFPTRTVVLERPGRGTGPALQAGETHEA